MAAQAGETPLHDFEAKISAFATELLDPYVEHLRYLDGIGIRPPSAKEVNDAVWGTVVVQPLEVIVLDSPLLQRLRRIRQLGVVDLVYPSAVHTRFEHSLGSLQQVTRVIDALNAHSDSPDLVDVSLRKVLRLAALCHDVGHGVMSHVAENALQNFDVVDDLRLQFSHELSVEKPSLSEIAAYYMLGSDGFRTLIKTAEDLLRDTDMPADAIDQIRKTIIGKQISDEIPLLHELISGPFDADKLDYMTRDAEMTGVPVVTDIPRLVQKVRAVKLTLAQLPERVRAQVPQGKPGYWLTGIHISGDRTLDELLIGRALLFDKLYRHQKVRAAEAMVAGIFREVGQVAKAGPAMLPYLIEDAQLLELDVAKITALAEEGRPGLADRAKVAADLAARLRARRLFVRAYAFATKMPLDPYRGDRLHTAGLQKLILDCDDSFNRGKLVEQIAEQVMEIGKVVALDETLRRLPTTDIKPYIWIDPPKPPAGASEFASAYLISNEGQPLRFGEESAEATSWTNAYLVTSDIGYVFTITELAPYVFIATERVLRERYDVRTPRLMYGYAKQFATRLDELKDELAAGGYYDDAPTDIKPLPQRLRKGDIPDRIQSVLERMRGYQGPVRESELKEQRRIPLARERVENWLRQFDDDLVDIALKTLERLAFVDRFHVVSGVDTFLANNEAYRSGALAPLGEPKDSSAIITYEAGDAAAAHHLAVKTLEQALAEEQPVIFVDDFIGSGSQAISILEAWLGLQPTTDLKEERPPLSESLRHLLKTLPIAFVFAAGTEDGRQRLLERCTELELNAQVHVLKTDLPTIHELDVPVKEQLDRFIERCREIGRDLLLNAAEGHDADWAEKRALGYGNRGYLLVFPYNTPAQTLTCLWASRDDVRWEPLLPRRKKR